MAASIAVDVARFQQEADRLARCPSDGIAILRLSLRRASHQIVWVKGIEVAHQEMGCLGERAQSIEQHWYLIGRLVLIMARPQVCRKKMQRGSLPVHHNLK